MDGPATARVRRRSLRDWLVDTGLFGCAVTYGVMWSVWLIGDPTVTTSTLVTQQVVAAVGCAALWLRRRWPVGLALVLVPLTTYADLATGAQLVALFTVAVHRPAKISAAICAANVIVRSAFLALIASPDVAVADLVQFSVVISLAVLGWGLFVRHRRQLVASLRERAERAEAEARLRAEQTQHLAREQIAREMHDVLGHRLSLLSVHAGALEYRPDAPAEEVAEAAAVIRASAHQALQDLREVIGVLRAPVGELPQPTLTDLPELVSESERAGMRVVLHTEVAADPPARLGRNAYRVVQEGLTNAHRHAPGAEVTVTVTGGPADGLVVAVANSAPEPWADHRASSGQGLIGLTERVALANGTLEYGRIDAGGFRLAAWLPWPA